ncbi:MAG: hypothetical protein IH585_11225 [Anaerolineaceae bacterium]|nr:hypothetical protein [Anaerolineaceae bacterium]
MVFIITSLLRKISLSDIRPCIVLDTESVFLLGQQKTFKRKPVILSGIIFVVIIIVGMVIPEMLIDQKYRGEVTREEFLQLIEANYIDYDHDKVRSLADDPDFVYIHTKAFYPRYYNPGEGEPGFNIEWISAQEYGNLGFMIVSPQITGATFKAEKSPDFFPHDADVFIIGKWVPSNFIGKYIEANVIYFPENGYLFTSQNYP